MQQVGHGADFPRAGFEEAETVAKGFTRFGLEAPGRLIHDAEVNGQGRQGLRGRVVQLPRNTSTLLVLRPQQTGRKLAEVLLGPLAFGDVIDSNHADRPPVENQ